MVAEIAVVSLGEAELDAVAPVRASASDCSEGIWTVRRGRLASEATLLTREGARGGKVPEFGAEPFALLRGERVRCRGGGGTKEDLEDSPLALLSRMALPTSIDAERRFTSVLPEVGPSASSDRGAVSQC